MNGMLRRPLALTLALLALALLAAPADAGEPEIFEPTMISRRLPEFGLALTPDGKTAFFNRSTADLRMTTILSSTHTDEGWSFPEPAPFSAVDTSDVDPFVTADGSRLWFASRREGGLGGLDLWYVERTDDGWGEPVNAGAPVNSESDDRHATATREGEVYFSSDRGGALRVYRSTLGEAGWSEPAAVSLGSVEEAGDPLIALDATFLLVTRAAEGDTTDLWISCPDGDGWGEPTRLPEPVNSEYSELAPALHPSEPVLFFTSERPGRIQEIHEGGLRPGDIWRVEIDPAWAECLAVAR